VTVPGAGAIGGWLGAGFAMSGAEVSLRARGATLDSVRRNGLILREGGPSVRSAHRPTPLGSIAAHSEVTRRLGALRTSILQDWEAGRPLELAPILGALVEVATPP